MKNRAAARRPMVLAGLAIVALPASAQILAEGVFVPAGHRPTAVVAAEFDGQPGVDLATVADGSGTLAILCNQGDGSFAAPILELIEAEMTEYSLCAADLDDDLDTDLVVSRGNRPLQILLNDGSAHFTPGQTLPTNGQWTRREICAGDIDHDGDQDILWSNQTLGGGLWLAENEGGTFAAPVELHHGKADDPVLAYLDADPHLDVAFHRHATPELVVLLGQGDGTFQSPLTHAPPTVMPLADLAVAEIDGDGDPDLAVIEACDYPEVWALMNQGGGEFGDAVMVAYGAAEIGLGLIEPDLDGSGCGDHVMLRDTIVRSVFWNDCSVDLENHENLLPLARPLDLTAADLDADGDLDVIYAVPDSSAVLVHENLRLEPVSVQSGKPHGGGGPRVESVHPNPCNPRAIIAFTVPAGGPVKLEAYDPSGRRVATILERRLAAGRHEVAWDMRDLASGIYLARLSACGRAVTARVALLR